jgi:hypothetical protein
MKDNIFVQVSISSYILLKLTENFWIILESNVTFWITWNKSDTDSSEGLVFFVTSQNLI